MNKFEAIYDMAALHKGSIDVVQSLMPEIKSNEDLLLRTDDRILSEMTKAIFKAGFSWKVIDSKWDGFEAAFERFDPVRWKFMSDDDLDSLLKDTRIVRNGMKIVTVRENASLVCDLQDEYGSAAKCIAEWEMTDFIGLLDMLKKRGSRLGGATAQLFLRFIGKDGFVLSEDVTKALIREGVVDKKPTSKGAMRKVQDAFNIWHLESGRPYAHISRILALSVG
ncbi:DNA-3-methyladenine glycosylase I [Kordiimonas sp. SCSIO 12610]|uniref:DNA-3-methyladenine glycosylase I n=1 Tax=Kordiimonas sp. SCSIO 12610 TaxID=2829597 RepID=UPI00210F1C39|nr:DNA-3-methyladenine glycosylase I [Kordiimonas sp. SCSIO 12610]UTW55236.1 DNA-3-methyladenine glycosylase I [Kordiimonas sp. SCSIO 12610]